MMQNQQKSSAKKQDPLNSKKTKSSQDFKGKTIQDIIQDATESGTNFFEKAKKMQEDVAHNVNDQVKNFMQNPTNAFKEATKRSGFDQATVFDAHRKNMETLNEANKMAVDVMRQITELQGQFMRQTFEDIDEVIRENLSFKSMNPQEQIAKNAQRLQTAVQRAMSHAGQISEVMLQSNKDLFKNVQNRFEEGIQEMKGAMNKTKH